MYRNWLSGCALILYPVILQDFIKSNNLTADYFYFSVYGIILRVTACFLYASRSSATSVLLFMLHYNAEWQWREPSPLLCPWFRENAPHTAPLFFFFLVFIYLAATGLSRRTQDLQSLLWHARSLVATSGTFSCGMWDLVP